MFLVKCQPAHISPVEQDLRKNLTKLIKFVVHPSAEISEELVNFALAAGGAPRTQDERLVYIGMMKKIARNTTEAIKNFTTTVTLADGTKIDNIDEAALDGHITTRAIEYVEKQKANRANTPTTSGNTASNGVASTGGSNIAPDLAANTNNFIFSNGQQGGGFQDGGFFPATQGPFGMFDMQGANNGFFI